MHLKGTSLTIYNTYRTHKKNLKHVGIETPWMKQREARKRDTGETLDPRKQYILDLISLIQEDMDKGYLSLVIGDFNKDLEDQEEVGIHMLRSSYQYDKYF